jgi:hypothetical protein
MPPLTARQDPPDPPVAGVRDEHAVARVEGEVVEAGLQARHDPRLTRGAEHAHDGARVLQRGVELPLRVELERDREGEIIGHDLLRPRVHVDAHDGAEEGVRRVELAVGAEVEAVELAEERRDRGAGHPEHRRVGQLRVELVESVPEEGLGHEQAPVRGEGDRIDERRDVLRGHRAAGCEPAHLTAEDVGPVERAVGTERDVVGAVEALVRAEAVDDPPGARVDDHDLAPEHRGHVDAPPGVDGHAVGAVDRRAADEHLADDAG